MRLILGSAHKLTLFRSGYFLYRLLMGLTIIYSIGKPVVLSAFGIVAQDTLQQFVPFNSTCLLVKPQQDWKRKSCRTTRLDRVFV